MNFYRKILHCTRGFLTRYKTVCSLTDQNASFFELASSGCSHCKNLRAQRLARAIMIKTLRDTKRLRGGSGANRLPGREATAAFQRLSAVGAALRQPHRCEDRYTNGGITRSQRLDCTTCNSTDSISDRRGYRRRFHLGFNRESQTAVYRSTFCPDQKGFNRFRPS
jgi:hypothetical protein